eukprot:scaffold132995_cov21-Tisochrysis_lutea.AAC.1
MRIDLPAPKTSAAEAEPSVLFQVTLLDTSLASWALLVTGCIGQRQPEAQLQKEKREKTTHT